jgi:hypothetical protein
MVSDQGADKTEPTQLGLTYAVTLEFILEHHEHTVRNVITLQDITFITTLHAQLHERIRTTLHHLRTYVLHQQALIHTAYPTHTNVPLPPPPLHAHQSTREPIYITTVYYNIEQLDTSNFYISSPHTPLTTHHPKPPTAISFLRRLSWTSNWDLYFLV